MALIQALKAARAILVLNVVDTVQLLQAVTTVRVWNRSANEIYCRMDGVDPAVAGDSAFLVPPSESRLFQVIDTENPEVRLISSLASSYAVEKES